MDRLRKYLRILLPALFIAYLGCIIAFTHVHIVNGVTIVHSHPFHKTDDGRPDHEHGYAEFQLLHQLSVLQITGAAFVAIRWRLFIPLSVTYFRSGLSGLYRSLPGKTYASCSSHILIL